MAKETCQDSRPSPNNRVFRSFLSSHLGLGNGRRSRSLTSTCWHLLAASFLSSHLGLGNGHRSRSLTSTCWHHLAPAGSWFSRGVQYLKPPGKWASTYSDSKDQKCNKSKPPFQNATYLILLYYFILLLYHSLLKTHHPSPSRRRTTESTESPLLGDAGTSHALGIGLRLQNSWRTRDRRQPGNVRSSQPPVAALNPSTQSGPGDIW